PRAPTRARSPARCAAIARFAARACPTRRARRRPRWRRRRASARSSATACVDGIHGRRRKGASVRCSSAHTLPEFGQALHRNRYRRAQLLREERHTQLFQQPAELLELGAYGAASLPRAELALERLLERAHLGRQPLVALG